eukprot:3164415-Pyramimonas_sp.AAC.1
MPKCSPQGKQKWPGTSEAGCVDKPLACAFLAVLADVESRHLLLLVSQFLVALSNLEAVAAQI